MDNDRDHYYYESVTGDDILSSLERRKEERGKEKRQQRSPVCRNILFLSPRDFGVRRGEHQQQQELQQV